MSLATESTSIVLPAGSAALTPTCSPSVREYGAQRALAPLKPPKLVRYSQIVQQPIQWMWKDRIALGKLTLVVGEPGLGKGLLTVDLAARVSRGSAWPGESAERAPLGTAILLHAEDDASDTVRARLSAAGADLDRIVTFEMESAAGQPQISQPFSLREGLAALDAALAATPDCRLVVIDPITAYLGDISGNQNHEVRSLLGSLADLARRRRVALVAVAHLNKQSSQRAVLRVMGALSFVATARTVWGVMRDLEKPDERVMLPLKNNLSEDNHGMRFRLPKSDGALAPRVEWEAELLPMSFQSFCNRKLSSADRQYFNTENHLTVRLQEELAAGPQERQWLDLMIPGSEEQLYRAAERLGVIKIKASYTAGWLRMLPDHYPAWQARQKIEQQQQKRERLDRKNKRRREARAGKPNASGGQPGRGAKDTVSSEKRNSSDEKGKLSGEKGKLSGTKQNSLAGKITPPLRQLLQARYPDIPAEQAMELLKQRFSQTVKDGMAEETQKRDAKRTVNEGR
jgi:hypothetical protein